jgi:hypothetical protein
MTELETQVRTRKEFENRAFQIYNADDLSEKMSTQGTPAVAIGYEMASPVDVAQGTQPATQVKKSFLYVTITFSILVGVEYSAQAETDTKPIATDLLDAVRKCLIGFKGVNGKPWRFAAERPMGSDDRGVIWYGQLWETDVPYESSK